jgi:hypothetical protein
MRILSRRAVDAMSAFGGTPAVMDNQAPRVLLTRLRLVERR